MYKEGSKGRLREDDNPLNSVQLALGCGALASIGTMADAILRRPETMSVMKAFVTNTNKVLAFGIGLLLTVALMGLVHKYDKKLSKEVNDFNKSNSSR